MGSLLSDGSGTIVSVLHALPNIVVRNNLEIHVNLANKELRYNDVEN